MSDLIEYTMEDLVSITAVYNVEDELSLLDSDELLDIFTAFIQKEYLSDAPHKYNYWSHRGATTEMLRNIIGNRMRY